MAANAAKARIVNAISVRAVETTGINMSLNKKALAAPDGNLTQSGKNGIAQIGNSYRIHKNEEQRAFRACQRVARCEIANEIAPSTSVRV
jgi:hypothetical protein